MACLKQPLTFPLVFYLTRALMSSCDTLCPSVCARGAALSFLCSFGLWLSTGTLQRFNPSSPQRLLPLSWPPHFPIPHSLS